MCKLFVICWLTPNLQVPNAGNNCLLPHSCTFHTGPCPTSICVSRDSISETTNTPTKTTLKPKERSSVWKWGCGDPCHACIHWSTLVLHHLVNLNLPSPFPASAVLYSAVMPCIPERCLVSRGRKLRAQGLKILIRKSLETSQDVSFFVPPDLSICYPLIIRIPQKEMSVHLNTPHPCTT